MKNGILLTTCAFLSLSLMNCVESGGTNPAEEIQGGGNITNPKTSELGLKEGVPYRLEDLFIKAEDIDLKKGMMIPKGTFILKSDETEEGYKRSSSGPWNFKGLSKIASTGTKTAEPSGPGSSGMFKRLFLVAGTSGQSCNSSSATRLELDLNRGAGGKYVFLCGESSSFYSDNIKPSSVYVIEKTSSAPPANIDVGFWGTNGSNGDMNQSAGGRYVYGRYTVHSGTCGIGAIAVGYADHSWEVMPVKPSPLWTNPSPDTDLNDGAGGAWIEFWFYASNGTSNCWS